MKLLRSFLVIAWIALLAEASAQAGGIWLKEIDEYVKEFGDKLFM